MVTWSWWRGRERKGWGEKERETAANGGIIGGGKGGREEGEKERENKRDRKRDIEKARESER